VGGGSITGTSVSLLYNNTNIVIATHVGYGAANMSGTYTWDGAGDPVAGWYREPYVYIGVYAGTSSLVADGIYTNVSGTNITGTGTLAEWDIELVPGVETIFDDGSMQFTAPADTDTDTQIHDRYLLYPKQNILR
jgi:hypothetical protein